MALTAIREFLKLEAAGGIVLVIAAALALVFANTPLGDGYEAALALPVTVAVGNLVIAKPLLLWINDGLMAIFFFLIGLEIKREVVQGELSSLSQAALPGFAAVGGMALPALVYVAFNFGEEATLRGWAIPAATDIAFALGVLALIGARAPVSLKIFLLALAIMDDLGAILIIAFFYTADLSLTALAFAGIGLVGLLVLNLMGSRNIGPYILIGLFVWVCVLKSGVHATLAGVAIAFFIPLRGKGVEEGHSPLENLEHAIHPWSSFFILPIFAFANAGVSLEGFTVDQLFEPVPLGIAAGLFVGKQIGVFGFTFAAVRLRIAPLPAGVTWTQIYGVALLTGIGFTMSLFIGTLAFEEPEFAAGVRLGVLSGSILSAVCGYLLLLIASPPAAAQRAEPSLKPSGASDPMAVARAMAGKPTEEERSQEPRPDPDRRPPGPGSDPMEVARAMAGRPSKDEEGEPSLDPKPRPAGGAADPTEVARAIAGKPSDAEEKEG